MAQHVAVRRARGAGFYAEVLLNRPDKLNVMSLGMVRELGEQVSRLRAEAQAFRGAGAPVMVMHGAGERAFCAGGDVVSLREDRDACAELFFTEFRLNRQLATAKRDCGLEQVSLWDGIVMGGGVGSSLHGSVRVASEKTVFAMPETSIGLFPDVGCTFALSQLHRGHAVGAYLGLTGARIGARDCLWAGLATHFLPSAAHDAFRAECNQRATRGEVVDVGALLADLAQSTERDELAEQRADTAMRERADDIGHCFSHDSVEEIVASLEELAAAALQVPTSAESSGAPSCPRREWALGALAALDPKRSSPLSLKISLHALRTHAAGDLDAALANEFRIAMRMCEPGSDFFEGIRALLVDKDRKPKWRHAKVADVTQDQVQAFFEPLHHLPHDYPFRELHFDEPLST